MSCRLIFVTRTLLYSFLSALPTFFLPACHLGLPRDTRVHMHRTVVVILLTVSFTFSRTFETNSTTARCNQWNPSIISTFFPPCFFFSFLLKLLENLNNLFFVCEILVIFEHLKNVTKYTKYVIPGVNVGVLIYIKLQGAVAQFFFSFPICNVGGKEF